MERIEQYTNGLQAAPVATQPRHSQPTRDENTTPAGAPDQEIHALRARIEAQAAKLEELQRQVLFLQKRESTLRAALFSARDQLVTQEAAPAPVVPGKDTVPAESTPLPYPELVQHIRAAASTALPARATVAVISRGDDDLLALNGRQGRHFPQTADGVYAGFYPSDGKTAIGHLESLRARGTDYLLIPSTAFWWLDHYTDFRAHLETRYTRIWDDECCKIYHLEAK